MENRMTTHLNYLAVLVCWILNFVVGGLWYSVLFGKLWMKATRRDWKKADMTGVGRMYGGAAAASLILVLGLAYILHISQATTVLGGLRVAWTLWVCMVCAATAGDYLFLRRGAALYAINMSLHLVNLTIGSVILVLWR